MHHTDKQYNQLGPWGLAHEVSENMGKTNSLQPANNEPMRTYRTIKLPRLVYLEQPLSPRKLEAKLSKRSIELDSNNAPLPPPRNTKMNGSVLHFFKSQHSHSKASRYESTSLDFTPHSLEKKLSTIRMGEALIPLNKQTIDCRANRYSLNFQASKKRSLKNLIQQINKHQQLIDLYLIQKKHR